MRIDLLPTGGNTYKANLHCHSKKFDSGAGLTPPEIKEIYKSRGYNIIAFSEHEKLTYNNDLNDDAFLALPAFETGMSATDGSYKIYHFNCFPKSRDVKENCEQLEYSLENANKRIRSLTDAGYIVMCNHSAASFHESEDFLGLEGLFAMEIYNNTVEIINRTGWSDVYYDTALRKGRRLWLVAADDSHSEYPCESPYYDGMAGFVMIGASALKQESVINALINGSFYSCVGKNGAAPQIHNMYIDNETFHANFTPVRSVYLKTSYWSCPSILSFADDITSAEFKIDKNWKYMRLEITDSNGHKALGNPYFL